MATGWVHEGSGGAGSSFSNFGQRSATGSPDPGRGQHTWQDWGAPCFGGLRLHATLCSCPSVPSGHLFVQVHGQAIRPESRAVLCSFSMARTLYFPPLG